MHDLEKAADCPGPLFPHLQNGDHSSIFWSKRLFCPRPPHNLSQSQPGHCWCPAPSGLSLKLGWGELTWPSLWGACKCRGVTAPQDSPQPMGRGTSCRPGGQLASARGVPPRPPYSPHAPPPASCEPACTTPRLSRQPKQSHFPHRFAVGFDVLIQKSLEQDL